MHLPMMVRLTPKRVILLLALAASFVSLVYLVCSHFLVTNQKSILRYQIEQELSKYNSHTLILSCPHTLTLSHPHTLTFSHPHTITQSYLHNILPSLTPSLPPSSGTGARV